MADYDYGSQRHALRAGTYNDNDLTGAYEVVQWPLQDQQAERAWRWFDPMRQSGVVREVDSVTDALDGTRAAFGGINFQWVFAPLLPSMVQYIRSAIFGGAWSAAVTVRTWDKAAGWRTLNALAVWNEPAAVADANIPMGYYQLKIDFRNGTTADPGGAFSNAFSNAFDI